MRKNPFDALVQTAKDQLERDKKTNEFIYSQTDSLITWLIGFSITGLLLIISNIASLKNSLKSSSKPIVGFLFFTIILGIAYRYVAFLMMIFQKRLDNYFYGIFCEWEMSPVEADPDIDNADFNLISKRLNDDFGIAITSEVVLGGPTQEERLPGLKAYYKDLCQYSKSQFDLSLRHLADVYQIAYKINKKETFDRFSKEMQEPNIGYNVKAWEKIRSCLYTLCLLFFVAVVSIVCYYLIFAK